MKKQVESWIFLADNDLYAAELLLKEEYPLTNIIAFHCQQMIEKYLKAFLIENDVKLVRTHDLIKLNEMVNEVKYIGIDEKKLLIINEVYMESRYPGDMGLLSNGIPSLESAKEFFEFANDIKTIIINILKN